MTVWMRWDNLEQALASAGRLRRKSGRSMFAVVFDDMGITGFVSPFAVVGPTKLWGRAAVR